MSIEKELRERIPIFIEDIPTSGKAHLIGNAQKSLGTHVLILTGRGSEESELLLDLPQFSDREIVLFPYSDATLPSADIAGSRFSVLSKLQSKKEPLIIFSSLRALFEKVIAPAAFDKSHLLLKKGEAIGLDGLIEWLKELGYEQTAICSDKGEFSVRGGLIDLFGVTWPEPVRIEFWGDEITSLRTFDPVGQKSIQSIETIEITPKFEEKKEGSLLDFLGSSPLIVFDELEQLEDKYVELKADPDFFRRIAEMPTLYFSQTPLEELSEVGRGRRGLTFEMFNQTLEAKRLLSPYAPLHDFLCPEGGDLLQNLSKVGNEWSIRLFVETTAEESLLRERLGIVLPHMRMEKGYLSTGFAIPDEKEILFSITDITKKTRIYRQKTRSTYHTPPADVFQFAVGDPVVHFHNGIAKFLGIEKKENNQGISSEFFHLEYADGARLFVPIKDAWLISKYVGSDATPPKLNVLGSSKWKKTKETSERAILGYAEDLLKFHAQREIQGGLSLPEDGELMQQFEETFPYHETEDQLTAIAEVKKDMTSKKAMDRLVCGDVGYGKTEVALRAAFKAVVDGGRQVALLVPTTVLALQHYESFVERMQYFPVKVGCLSRFHTPKENKLTLEGLKQGAVDIVVGTHRLISKDVSFKNLGLVIIDEEQRFGVRAKEHLKTIKAGVDVLTLSATPIPRTLYMSLVGARDLSVINTPPQERLPIRSMIVEPQDKLIKEALLRELSRGGQAFVIHNRVETIWGMMERIQKLVPEAKIVVGHGQMSGDELDQVFHSFKSGQADILISTSIVENGIDIPNANTILIDRADYFGLAELYQLRGRVGRWNRSSFCYFMIPKLHALPEITRKRISALAESSGYGGGMRLAMRDLEIRGAGDILGTEQSGHIAGIGFYLYCKLLKKTIRMLQKQGPAQFLETKVEFSVDARLPEAYVNAPSLRMEFYQRFGEGESLEEIEEIFSELEDRFGRAPLEAVWLYCLARLRLIGQAKGYTLIKGDKNTLILEKEGVMKKSLFQIPKLPRELEEKILPIL